MLWILLAAQLSLPVPVGLRFPDVRSIFSPDDMPAYVQRAGVTRFVPTRTTIRPDGTPRDCSVESSSGDPKLDIHTCAIILRRAKFERARWVDGSPAYAIVTAPVTWAIGDDPSKGEIERAFPPDIELSVNRLPAGVGRHVAVRLKLAVDKNGRVVDCGEAPPVLEADRKPKPPELVKVSCDQAISQFIAIPAKDDAGEPVRSVQSASVIISGP